MLGQGIKQWRDGNAYTVTFVVTENCNLRCKYCYETQKSNKTMFFDMAKKAVDYLLNNQQYIVADAIILEFIGGEPFLEIELVDKITDYFKVKSYRDNHKWAKNYRINISSNGTLYSDERVVKYIKKNNGVLNVGISIDGNKEKHDLQRVYPDGSGTYDDVIRNIEQWKKDFYEPKTKVTIGHDDLPYMKDSIIHLWNLGLEEVPANIVFEDVWQEGDDAVFEKQLKKLADYTIDNRLWQKNNCTLFDTQVGYPVSKKDLNSNWCGAGRMLAIDADGNFYPCLRYLGMSLNNQKPYIIGNCIDGLDFERIRPFMALDYISQSTAECLECEISNGCAWCQGSNYDFADTETNYQRQINVCQMHKARVRANNYLWGRLENEFGVSYSQPLSLFKKHLYFITADDCVEHCEYRSKDNSSSIMSEEVIKKAFEFCEREFFVPVILYSKNKDNLVSMDRHTTLRRYDIVSSDNCPAVTRNTITVFSSKNFDSSYNSDGSTFQNCVLNMFNEDLDKLGMFVRKLLKRFERVNINVTELESSSINIYKEELMKIASSLVDYYKQNDKKSVNLLTDRLYLDEMNNCDFGVHNFAVAPNGKLYICPASYFDNSDNDIGSIEEGISVKNAHLLKLEYAPICNQCEAYQCNRCVCSNKKVTNEYNSPSSLQCMKSHIERNVSMKLYNLLKQEGANVEEFIELKELSYSQPIEIILGRINTIQPYNKHAIVEGI